MTRDQFETFLKRLTNYIKPEEANDRFSKGYAIGKLMVQMMNNMTDVEKEEFQEGFHTGLDVPRRHTVH